MEYELRRIRKLAIQEKVYGPDHPVIAECLVKLTNLYVGNENPARAEPLLQRALAIQEKVYGPDHPVVAECLVKLTNLYIDK